MPSRSGDPSSLVIDVGCVRTALIRAGRLLLEAAVVPTLLLALLLHLVGLGPALGAALGWVYLTVAVRWLRGHGTPGTLLLCASMLSGRALFALATSSAFVYLLQPVLGSVVMGALFLGSAVLGRPVTVRLARDFVAVPDHVLDRRGVQRMFTQVAVMWGLSRLADAGMNLAFLRAGIDAGLLSRGVLSPVLTVVTVALCVAWGRRALRRDGVALRLGVQPA